MGFGLLLIGYFAVYLMTMNPLGALIRVAGYCLITYASCKLKKYHSSFFYLTAATIAMTAISVVLLGAYGVQYLYEMMWIDRLWIQDSHMNIIGYVHDGASFFFHAAMLYGIWCIAKDTEIKKISTNAIRNFIFICFYYFVYLLSFLPFQGIRDTQLELGIIKLVTMVLWLLFNILLLFSCYTKICDENDTDMARAPSKIGWINRWWEAFDKREEKAMRESAEYRKEKQRKRRK